MQLRFGNLIISLHSADRQSIVLPSEYQSFVSSGEPDIDLLIKIGELPELELAIPTFDSGHGWRLYSTADGKIVIQLFRRNDIVPSRMAVLSPDLSTGHIYVTPQDGSGQLGYPLREPLDNLITTILLSRGKGVMLHACGLVLEDQGLLFVGDSGAGKSTMGSLWRNHGGSTILSDDHVIVHRESEQFRIYGTPWYSQTKVMSPDGASLARIFFIEHSPVHEVTPLKPLFTSAGLITHSFPTYWDREGMAFSLDFCSKIAGSVPSHRLGFAPDDSIVRFIRCLT